MSSPWHRLARRSAVGATVSAALMAGLTSCGSSPSATRPSPSASSSAQGPSSSTTSMSASSSASPSPGAGENATTSPTAQPAAASQQPPGPLGPQAPAAANVVAAWIPYGDDRKAQMAEYARLRYGTATWQLRPQAIVLHFTESDDDPWSTINYFATNQPNGGTYPNVCTHFVLGKDGTAYQLVPTDVMCRHTIGLNHVALGIEVVQASQGNGSQWAEQQILNRPAQVGALVRLVKSLQTQYGIPTDRVLGHGTANADPQFLDLTGLRNDHTDWGWASIQQFRDLLDTTP